MVIIILSELFSNVMKHFVSHYFKEIMDKGKLQTSEKLKTGKFGITERSFCC
jgi:hypothetical protein